MEKRTPLKAFALRCPYMVKNNGTKKTKEIIHLPPKEAGDELLNKILKNRVIREDSKG